MYFSQKYVALLCWKSSVVLLGKLHVLVDVVNIWFSTLIVLAKAKWVRWRRPRCEPNTENNWSEANFVAKLLSRKEIAHQNNFAKRSWFVPSQTFITRCVCWLVVCIANILLRSYMQSALVTLCSHTHSLYNNVTAIMHYFQEHLKISLQEEMKI